MKLIYVPGTYAVGEVLALPEEVQHRLYRVMRMGVGERVQVFDGTGQAAAVEMADAKCRTALVTEILRGKAPLPRRVLVLGMPKRDAWETVLRQATEMGVTEIVPLKTRFSQVGKLNLERAQGQLVEAAEQCERYELPELRAMVELEAFLDGLAEPCAWAYERLEGEGEVTKAEVLLVGPEGGFAAEEVALLKAHKMVAAFSLGATILRTDTAVVAGLARLSFSY